MRYVLNITDRSLFAGVKTYRLLSVNEYPDGSVAQNEEIVGDDDPDIFLQKLSDILDSPF